MNILGDVDRSQDDWATVVRFMPYGCSFVSEPGQEWDGCKKFFTAK